MQRQLVLEVKEENEKKRRGKIKFSTGKNSL